MCDRKRVSVSQTSVFEIVDRPQYLVLNDKKPARRPNRAGESEVPMTMTWHRLPHLRRRCGVSVSDGLRTDPINDISIAHGVDSFKVKVLEETQDGREVSVLLEQTLPDRSAGCGDDEVDPVRIEFLRIGQADTDQMGTAFVNVENLFLFSYGTCLLLACSARGSRFVRPVSGQLPEAWFHRRTPGLRRSRRSRPCIGGATLKAPDVSVCVACS